MPRMTSAGVQWTPMLNHTPIPHLQRLKELGDHTDPSHFWNRLYDSNKDAPLSVFTCTPRSVPVSAVRGRRVSVPGAVVTRAKARKARLERKNNRNENKDAKEEDDNDAGDDNDIDDGDVEPPSPPATPPMVPAADVEGVGGPGPGPGPSPVNALEHDLISQDGVGSPGWSLTHTVMFVRLYLLDVLSHTVGGGEHYNSNLPTPGSDFKESPFATCYLQNNDLIDVAEALLRASILDASNSEEIPPCQIPSENLGLDDPGEMGYGTLLSASKRRHDVACRRRKVQRMVNAFLGEDEENDGLNPCSQKLLLSRVGSEEVKQCLQRMVLLPHCSVDLCWKLIVGSNKMRDRVAAGQEMRCKTGG
mmetsp:Transcript_11317/g.18325  ORF Transcript_11317/g.18325 Transcript_11317/m.18325 type:complete len:362 (+) Transcript_11317:7305-8390(+)